MDYALGGLAAVSAGCFSNPLDVIKIRMQLQGELKQRGTHAVHYKNIFHGAYVIAKHDGLLALQAGLQPALFFQFVLNGVRLGTYNLLVKAGVTRNALGEEVFLRNVAAGAATGVLGGVVSSPFFLIKTHLQSRAAATIASGHQHEVEGLWSGLHNIYRNHGIRGLFRGTVASVPRLGVGSCVQLTTFAHFKEWLLKYEPFQNRILLLAFVGSMMSGVLVTIAMTPLDLISTRLYNQGVGANGKGLLYDGYVDCVRKVMRTEGFIGFYKGMAAVYLRIGPHTVLTLMFWDFYKDIFQRNFAEFKI